MEKGLFCRNAPMLQKFDAAVLDVIHRTDDPQACFLLDVMDAQALFDLLHTVPDVEAAGLVGVGLLSFLISSVM